MREVRLPLSGAVLRVAEEARGTPALDLPPTAFVAFLENHDQVANSAFGRRLHQRASPGRLRALTALLLLGPATPMLFQGQEFGSSPPFLFFADHKTSCRGPIRKAAGVPGAVFQPRGPRRQASCRHQSTADDFKRASWIWPSVSATPRPRTALAICIALRQGDPVLARGGTYRRSGPRSGGTAAALFRRRDGDRLLIVNLGCDLDLTPAPEPLLAPPTGAAWQLAWSSEPSAMAGRAPPPIDPAAHWHLPGSARCSFVCARSTRMTDTDLTSDARRSRATNEPDEPMPRREWLVTNGLGGYASGTVAGAVRAAITACSSRRCRRRSAGRDAEPSARARPAARGRPLWLGDEDEVAGPNAADRTGHLAEFALELGLPVWRYAIGGVEIEKRIVMPYGQNTVHITYRLLSGDGPVRLTLRPSVHFRPYEAPVDARAVAELHDARHQQRLRAVRRRHPARCVCVMHGRAGGADAGCERACRTCRTGWRRVAATSRSVRSGARATSAPTCCPDEPVTLVASTEPWETIHALPPEDARDAERTGAGSLLAIAEARTDRFAAELVLAADQFIITPAGRAEEAARARAAGEHVRTVIAGYHWFTDWGRDTMISLEGLTLDDRPLPRSRLHPPHVCALRPRRPDPEHVSGRRARGAVSHRRRDAVVLPRGRALRPSHRRHRHAARCCCRHSSRSSAGTSRARGSGSASIRPTACCARVQQGYQLTWMDAKVDDWVVTPRRGKAVEINALWYNALRLLDGWVRELWRRRRRDRTLRARGPGARRPSTRGSGRTLTATCSTSSMASRATTRPAVRTRCSRSALDHPVLARERWEPVMDVVQGPAADAGRAALARARASGLQGALLRRPALARCGVSPGHGVGLADRTVMSMRG